MNAEEKKAHELINQHLPKFPISSPGESPPKYTYQKLVQLGVSGFVNYYLAFSLNDQTMSTTADYNVTVKLAEIDKQRDDKNDCSLLV